jgi:concanavalin A-like lectin/glucanase superfamily protein
MSMGYLLEASGSVPRAARIRYPASFVTSCPILFLKIYSNQNGLILVNADAKTGWSVELNSGRATFWVADSGGTWRFARNTTVLAANIWYHIAVTYSAGTATVYVNGAPGGSTTNIGSISQGPWLRLGGLSGDPFFNGRLDEIRLSNVIRYSQQFTPPTAPFTVDAGTLALYHLNEGSGQAIGDSSPNHYTLTLGTQAASDTADPLWVSSTAPIGP